MSDLPAKPEVIEVEKPRPSACPREIPALDIPKGSNTDDVEKAQQTHIRVLRRHLRCWLTGEPVEE